MLMPINNHMKIWNPFFICQFEIRRSVSTFQVRLLQAIANLKSPKGITVPSMHNGGFEQPTGIMKSHTPEIALECIDKGYPFFASDAPYNLIIDNIDEKLTKCSLYQAGLRLSAYIWFDRRWSRPSEIVHGTLSIWKDSTVLWIANVKV